jgi:anti-anti-sigma regulatory factor
VAEAGFDNLFNAGIVRKDNEIIMDAAGFMALRFSNSNKKSSGTARFFKLVGFFFQLPKNSLVVFHFPLYATAYKWLLRILKWRSISTAAIIIDIDGLRDKDSSLLKKEIQLLSHFKYIVAHNTAMKEWLLLQLPTSKIYTIQFFDYPAEGTPAHRNYSTAVCFAGSLSKSTFIYSLKQTEQLRLNVYGEGYDATLHAKDGFTYKGIYKPSLLPMEMEGSFGLVWDGDSVYTCDEYLKYNNPHKLSLYLSAGLPVIAWEQSAIVKMVKEKNIGITINNLPEIEQKIKAVSQKDYHIMQQNAVLAGQQIRKGEYLNQIMEQIRKDMQSSVK